MGENILEIKNLAKSYGDFRMRDVNMEVPKGCIMGLIGENGAGKSTLIKLILNLVHKESGEILIFGKDNIRAEREVKEDIGVVFSELNLPATFTGDDVDRVMKGMFAKWDEQVFDSYLRQFSLNRKMKVKDYSRGMKMKLAIAIALSHHSRLLLLDEPTSGLDPVVRDEILDIFMDFIQDEEHTILISSHIISDLERIADYIAFIHKGQFLLCEEKDRMLEEYGILKCTDGEYGRIQKDRIIGCRKSSFGVEALVKRADFTGDFVVDHASLEEIMLFYVRRERI